MHHYVKIKVIVVLLAAILINKEFIKTHSSAKKVDGFERFGVRNPPCTVLSRGVRVGFSENQLKRGGNEAR